MTSRIWLPICGYPNYQVSSDGQVANTKTGRILKQNPHAWGGYFMVRLYDGGAPKDFLVHRLVLSAFDPRPDESKLEGNHKNTNRKDNRLDNLEWVTHSGNMKHSVSVHGPTVKGPTVGTSKLIEEQVREIRRLAADGYSQDVIAVRYNITQPAVSAIVRRVNWKWLD